MKTRTLRFEFEKDTKHTVRYKEATGDEAPIIGTLYLQKWFAGAARSVELTVSVPDLKDPVKSIGGVAV
jgi:23S rRNA maturation mini-RNase III